MLRICYLFIFHDAEFLIRTPAVSFFSMPHKIRDNECWLYLVIYCICNFFQCEQV